MSNKDALHAYLLKNYGSNDKHQKKKKKKKKKANKTTIDTLKTLDNSNQNIKTNIDDDDYVMKMPNLSDGSGWKTHTNILAPSTLHNDNNNPTNRKRKHNETESISSPPNKKVKRQRYDTDTDSDCDDIQINRPQTQIKIRHDTSDEDNDSDSDSSDIKVRRKPIKSEESDSDSDIEVTRKTDSNKINIKSEKRKNIKSEKRKNIKSEKTKKEPDDSMEWASGLTQKYQAFEKAVFAQREKYKSIATYKDDAEMNKELENEYNEEDPLNKMEGYGDNNRNKKGDMDVLSSRPMYKGKAWANRYKILPGYRWDGIDRSNGFERKKLLHASQRIDHKKKKYQWAISDM